jgi:excisionase family DNA binding protein
MSTTDRDDVFDTPRDTDRTAHRAARAKSSERLSAEELLGRPTLRPTQRLDDPAAADSDAPLLVDAVTAAKLLGLSRTTLDKLVRDGRLERVKLGGRVLFSTELLRRIARGEA